MNRIENATGLILRTRLFTETSLIVQWLTPEWGRLSTVAKGARRPNSPVRGKLDLFYSAEFSFARSRRSELHTLREVRLLDSRHKLRENLAFLQQASYAAALVEQVTEAETPLPEIFLLTNDFLNVLPQQAPQPQTVFALELKLLQELGLNPLLEKTSLSPGSIQIIKTLLESNFETVPRLRLHEKQTLELRQFLHGFLVFHLGKIPCSRNAALTLASG